MPYTFRCGNDEICINRTDALRLELLLNESIYKCMWNSLGDTLYEIHTTQAPSGPWSVISADQMRWLRDKI